MPKRMTGAERRNLILEEACQIFAFKGIHGTTTKEIAKAVGISEPVLYQHFSSKEEIYQTLELICSQQTAYLKKLLANHGQHTESLILITYLLVRIISFAKRPGTESEPKKAQASEILLRLMGYSFLEDGRFARSLVENCIGAFFDQWHGCYKKALADGHLNVSKSDSLQLWLAYESIIGIGLFVLPNQRLIEKIKDQDEGAKAATLFLLRAIGLKESVIEAKVDWPALKRVYAQALAESGSL